MRVTDLLSELRIPYVQGGEHHHARTGWVQIDCPYCGSVGKWHMGISLATGRVNCWRCGPSWLPSVLATLTGATVRESKGRVGSLDLLRTPPRRHRGKLVLPRHVDDLQPPHRRYLEKRGFDPDEIARVWGVGGIGPVGGLRWRLFIPITLHGETVSWTTRAIGGQRQRYVSASEEEESVPHRSLLYGEEYCTNAVVVHEGPTDAWATGPGAVATCGTSYTREQVRRMARYAVRVVCFDGSDAAQRRADVLADTLAPHPGTTDVVRLDAPDAASADDSELEYLRGYLR